MKIESSGRRGSQPVVSIFMPTYNRATLIGDAIDSIIRQSFKDWHLHIINDGSADSTEHAVRKFNDPRIIYSKVEHTGHLARLRNIGLENADSSYICFADSDDVWVPEKLEKQLSLFRQNPGIHFLITNGYHFGENVSMQPPDLEKDVLGDLFNALVLEQQLVIYTPSLMFRRDVLEKIPELDETFRSCCDIDFIFKLARQFRGGFLAEKLVGIRKHEASMSANLGSVTIEEMPRIYSDLFQRKDITREQFLELSADHFYKAGYEMLKKNKIRKARNYFQRALKFQPYRGKLWLRYTEAVAKSLLNKTTATS